MTTHLYTDGGTLGPNPSHLGGTWAWCWVSNNQIIRHASGILEPEDIDMKTCSNNVMELVAAVRGVASLHENWDGFLYSDSIITLYRMTSSDSFTGVPNWLRQQALDLRRHRKWKTQLLGGHPSRKELECGHRADGKPVSRWNVYVDNECNRLAQRFLKGR